MHLDNTKNKKALTARLRRAEGQLRGVVDMIEADADCVAVATQLAACKSAVNHALGALASCAIEEVRNNPKASKKQQETIDTLLKLVL